MSSLLLLQWQACGSYGPNKNTYHDASGSPVVNTARFPSLGNMTAYAHSLGLKAGWYGNVGLVAAGEGAR